MKSSQEFQILTLNMLIKVKKMAFFLKYFRINRRFCHCKYKERGTVDRRSDWSFLGYTIPCPLIHVSPRFEQHLVLILCMLGGTFIRMNSIHSIQFNSIQPIVWNLYLTHCYTMPHFDVLKIYSCGKHCEQM